MSSLFFFFKQKTAYEMRISDWSSDVCSSDLAAQQTVVRLVGNQFDETPRIACCQCPWHSIEREQRNLDVQALRPCCRFSEAGEIGRASCRERVCQYV